MVHVASAKKRPPLHPLEKSLLGLLIVQMIFTPWAWGTMHPWSQITAAVLGALCLALALVPRRYTDDLSVQGDFRIEMWPRLVRFPIFWFGLLLLLLLIVQALNANWVWRQNDRYWWLEGLKHVEWLPTSTRTEFSRYNLWRSFLVYSAIWMTICAIWVGVIRRRTLQLLILAVLGNAVALSLVGIIHRFSNEPKALWIRSFKDASSFSSFVYQNHGGAYLALMASAALGMAVWHFFEGRKRMARSTPTAVWLLVAVFLNLAVIFSLSRGATITLAVFAVAAVAAFFLVRSANPIPSTTPKLVSAALAIVFIGALGFVVRHSDFGDVQRKFTDLTNLQFNEPSVSSRALARQAATDMWYDHWALGTGAGSFRFLFPQYVRNYPEAYEGGRAFWEHAHIDWLQIPIELGLPGVLLIAGAAGWMTLYFFRLRGWRHPLVAILFLGSLQTLLHAVADFPFQNPAVHLAWWALLIIGLRWLELDSGSGKKSA